MRRSLILQVLILILLTFFIREIIYYFYLGGKLDVYFILNSIFFIIGVYAGYISLMLFNQLKKEQEISMLSIFLSFREFKNEIKLLYFFSFITGASFFVYSIFYGAQILIEAFRPFEWFVSILFLISYVCFLTFIVSFVLLVRKWEKRFEKYGGFGSY
ncbi:MAG: hypothetical protein NZ942_02235 [Candidatus Aenigmarchaeota archaeon]|nr:hypothetical protein [Candidatus Aenigmarchaeota archaeon]